jgi:acyl-CoA thioesterase-1
VRARTYLLLLTMASLMGCGDSEPESTPEPATFGDGGARPESAGPTPDAVQVPEDAPMVLVLGDSIAAGLHLPRERAFPAALQRQMAAAGQPFHLVNAGVSGDTSAGGLARLDWLLQQQPDVLIVELGANDGLRGVKVSATEQNLREILTRTQAAGPKILLLGVRIPPSMGPDYSEAFAGIYTRLAQELEVELVPFFMQGVAGVPALNLPDELHPTAEGHELIASNVAAGLSKLLE